MAACGRSHGCRCDVHVDSPISLAPRSCSDPSPIHPLPRLSEALGGEVEIWAKREDCNSGIAFGGNKVRKLEYLVADALATGCDTLVSIGGIQSNHTRQVTGVARHLGLGCVTVQEGWVDWPDEQLRQGRQHPTDPHHGRRRPDRPRRLRHRYPGQLEGGVGLGRSRRAARPTRSRPAPRTIRSGASGFANWAVELAAEEREIKREARAAATVTHENVIPIHAVSESQGHSYIVMQYVPGQSLQQRLQQRGQFEVVEILRIGMQVARALHAAHEQGLVHRDIKPANILLEEGIDRPLVTDFGLARVANDASLTRSGAVAGTPNFMSPEQASGESVDARSDLFSLGSVMYAMCVGHPPFRAETIVGVLRKVCDTEPASMREQNSSIPAWLEAFILKLLAKSREARFPSAAEVAELLSLELAHHQNPTAQCVPPRQWWTGRARQRDRVVHWLWGTGGVASLAGLVVALGTLTAAFTPPATVPSSQAEGHAVVLGSAPSATERITGSSSRDAMAENRDAWQAALEAAVITSQQLEAKWWQPEVSPFYDPWDQEVGEVLKQLQRLESSVP